VLNMIKILFVSDRVDTFSINYIYEMSDNDTKIQLPDLPMYVIVNINKIKCEDLEVLHWKAKIKLTDIAKWISSDINPTAGSGFNEELIQYN